MIAAKADIALDAGIYQHLGAEDTGRMGAINGAPLQADTMKTGLNNYILLGMNGAAYLMPLPRWYVKFISQTAKLKAVLKTRRGAIVTRSQYVFISHGYGPYVMPTAG